VVPITATIEKDQWITICELANVHPLPFGNVQAILTDDMTIVKKSTHWVSKLLSTAQKQQRVHGVQRQLPGPYKVVIAGSAVSFNTPGKPKNSSSQGSG
jgi:hypothetical protein